MQVTKQVEDITSLVVGGSKTHSFTAKVDANLLHNLSQNLYTYKTVAAVREVMCNAWDSHIASNIKDTAISICFDDEEEQLIIRDFGKGINPEEFYDIYGTFGHSTKEFSLDETGGFGYGSKAPFAHSDVFYVANNYEGTRYLYVMSRVTEDGGMPGITLLTKTPSQHSGLEVFIPYVKSKFELIDIVDSVSMTGGMNIVIVSKDTINVPVHMEWKDIEGDIFLVDSSLLLKNCENSRVLIRYGSVVYPIPVDKHYSKELFTLQSHINDRINQYRYSCTPSRHSLIIKAAPNTLAITPSRESLAKQIGTQDTIKELLISATAKIKQLKKEGYSLVLEKLEEVVNSLSPSEYTNITRTWRGHYAELKERVNKILTEDILKESHTITGKSIGAVFDDTVKLVIRREADTLLKKRIVSRSAPILNKHDLLASVRKNILSKVADTGLTYSNLSVLDTRIGEQSILIKEMYRMFRTDQLKTFIPAINAPMKEKLRWDVLREGHVVVYNTTSQFRQNEAILKNYPSLMFAYKVGRSEKHINDSVGSLKKLGLNPIVLAEPTVRVNKPRTTSDRTNLPKGKFITLNSVKENRTVLSTSQYLKEGVEPTDDFKYVVGLKGNYEPTTFNSKDYLVSTALLGWARAEAEKDIVVALTDAQYRDARTKAGTLRDLFDKKVEESLKNKLFRESLTITYVMYNLNKVISTIKKDSGNIKWGQNTEDIRSPRVSVSEKDLIRAGIIKPGLNETDKTLIHILTASGHLPDDFFKKMIRSKLAAQAIFLAQSLSNLNYYVRDFFVSSSSSDPLSQKLRAVILKSILKEFK